MESGQHLFPAHWLFLLFVVLLIHILVLFEYILVLFENFVNLFLLRLKTFHIDLKILLCYSLIMGDEKMTVNERIKIIRTENNLTLEKFGERIGVTKSTISNIENGTRNATEHMIKSICREFDYTEEWLRNGIEPKKPTLDEDIEYGQICAEIGITDNRAKQIILNYGRMSSENKNTLWESIDKLFQR